MKNQCFDLTGKLSIVTGGGTGLGLAMAQMLVEYGSRVVIVGRREDILKDAVVSLGSQSAYVCSDLSELANIPGLVASIEKEYGQIDILINNAGIHIKKEVFEYTDEDYQRVVLTNQTSVFVLSREVGKRMASRKQGCILMISSMASQYGIPKVIGYTAAKSAVEGMTRGLAVELSPMGVRVNCIAPGFIFSKMSAAALDKDPERKNKVLSRTPMGHLGQPEDVAHAALFLCSDAARYITGVVLPVDGGNSIGF